MGRGRGLVNGLHEDYLGDVDPHDLLWLALGVLVLARLTEINGERAVRDLEGL